MTETESRSVETVSLVGVFGLQIVPLGLARVAQLVRAGAL